jgi:ABC-type Na+ transport system ATPase subunit NatA
VRGLTVRYGATTALEGLDLEVCAGEMFVLLGGSGSGKTTLIHVVRLDDGTLLRVSEALRDGLGAGEKPIGAAVTVGWRPDACILLPG